MKRQLQVLVLLSPLHSLLTGRALLQVPCYCRDILSFRKRDMMQICTNTVFRDALLQKEDETTRLLVDFQQQDGATAEARISCRAAQHSISTRCICVPIHYLCAQGNRICARSVGNISLVSRDGLRRKCRVIHCDFQRTATTRMDQSKKVRETTKLKPFPTVFSLSSLTSFQIREFVNFGRVGYL